MTVSFFAQLSFLKIVGGLHLPWFYKTAVLLLVIDIIHMSNGLIT